jgi:hypothetical protein
MITITQQGTYHLVDTKDKKRMLYLDDQGYIWKFAPGIGDLLVFSKHPHKREDLLAQGLYRIYDVHNEPHLVDLQHLELSVQPSVWQGYLLLTGLPTAKKIRSRIIATNELLSRRPAYRQTARKVTAHAALAA